MSMAQVEHQRDQLFTIKKSLPPPIDQVKGQKCNFLYQSRTHFQFLSGFIQFHIISVWYDQLKNPCVQFKSIAIP